jgi:hypothetical protein
LKIIYLLSDIFDYTCLVCDDAGPEYAQAMNWDCLYLSNFPVPDKDHVFIIDNRVQPQDLHVIEAIIKQNTNVKFFLKIVDPYLENSEHYYYQFLSRLSSLTNTGLLSVYQAVELTASLKSQFNDRFVHLPYPYLAFKEVNAPPKKNKIIISGAVNQAVYPYRTAIWQKVTRSVTRLFFFYILRHPGYIDLSPGVKHRHSFIGESFIQKLSQYKYMLLCSSRCGIEFLKFNECAYAGCLPVGHAPNTYPEHIKALFLQLRISNFITDTLKIISGKHSQDIIEKLRLFLRETRSPDALNKKIKEGIETTFYTS